MENVFGREEQASTDLLLTYIYNNISLGQWELAFACITEFQRRHINSSTIIVDLLRSLSKNSEDVCQSCRDGSQLFSWLCANQLTSSIMHEDHIILKCEAEFRQLLIKKSDIFKGNDENLSKLYAFFKWTRSKRNFSVPLLLSTQLQQLLKEWLNKTPKFGYEVMEVLSVDQKRSKENNELIENVYVETIIECFKEIPKKYTNYSKHIYKLLQFYDSKYSSEKLSPVIPEMVRHCDKEKVYNCLLGKDYIIKPFHDNIVNFHIDDKFQDADLNNDETFLFVMLTKSSIESDDWLSLFHGICNR